MSSFSRSRLLAFALALTPAVLFAQMPGSSYHVTKRIKVGGDGGWDYLTVDTAAHRLYLSRGTHVQVVDLDRDSLIGDIPNTPGVHGVAVASEFGKGFTSNGRDSSVTIFDLKTLAPLSVVHGTGRNPDAIYYEPMSKRVFTFNGGSASATAIDAATGAIVGTVDLGGKPEAANDDGHGRIFVNIEDKNEVVAFDAKSLGVIAHWPLGTCEEPTGQGIDRKGQRLFIACSNKQLAVVDYGSGKVVTMLPSSEGTDGAGFDEGLGMAFASGGDGTMTVVHQATPDVYHVAATVPTMSRARTMMVDQRTHKVYTVSAEYGPTPAATTERPRPRPPMIPGSFTIIVLEK
jgi:hypothetical protein